MVNDSRGPGHGAERGMIRSPVAFAPGTRLGSYGILSLLGAGGMGEVFPARDTRLARDVAIKSCQPVSLVTSIA
jgi:serine/threonine protein kinase